MKKVTKFAKDKTLKDFFKSFARDGSLTNKKVNLIFFRGVTHKNYRYVGPAVMLVFHFIWWFIFVLKC